MTTTSTAGPARFDRSAHPVTPEPTGAGGCVLTIGVFDGFHLGHQQLIARTVLEAGRKHVPAVLMTFDPHPLAVVDCARAPRQLTTVSQRIEYARNGTGAHHQALTSWAGRIGVVGQCDGSTDHGHC